MSKHDLTRLVTDLWIVSGRDLIPELYASTQGTSLYIAPGFFSYVFTMLKHMGSVQMFFKTYSNK